MACNVAERWRQNVVYYRGQDKGLYIGLVAESTRAELIYVRNEYISRYYRGICPIKV